MPMIEREMRILIRAFDFALKFEVFEKVSFFRKKKARKENLVSLEIKYIEREK